jgi:hypothetical protein
MNMQDRLYEKARAEFNAFVSDSEKLTGKEALELGYEKSFKDDFLCILESAELPDESAKALLKLKNPLDSLYEEWLKNDYSHMDLLRDTVDDLAAKEIRLQRSRGYSR